MKFNLCTLCNEILYWLQYFDRAPEIVNAHCCILEVLQIHSRFTGPNLFQDRQSILHHHRSRGNNTLPNCSPMFNLQAQLWLH